MYERKQTSSCTMRVKRRTPLFSLKVSGMRETEAKKIPREIHGQVSRDHVHLHVHFYDTLFNHLFFGGLLREKQAKRIFASQFSHAI